MLMSVISDEISQDIETAAATACACGFTGLEIRSAFGRPPHRLTDGDLRRIVEVAHVHGLSVSAFCPSVFKCTFPKTLSERNKAQSLLARSVEQAAVLGCSKVRAFSFYRPSVLPLPVAAAHEALMLLDGVQTSGTRFLVETGTRTNTPTLATAREFQRVLDRADVGLLWDPGNGVSSGFESVPFVAHSAALKYVEHVHVKDPLVPRAGIPRYVPLGSGVLPWQSIIAALSRHGFRGWLTLETHWRTDRILKPEQLDQPWGEEFSRGGVEASRISMLRLRELVEAVDREVGRP